MNRLQQLARSIKTVKGAMEDVFLRNLQPSSYEGNEVLMRAYSKMELVYICISTTARAISQVPLTATLPPKQGSETRRPVPQGHPWMQRITYPNPIMSSTGFVEALVGYLLLDGEYFIVPFPKALGETPPGALYVVRGKYMDEMLDGNGQLIGWKYQPYIDAKDTGLRNTSFTFGADEVVHGKLWNPYHQVRGLSPLQAGELSLLSDYRSMQYNSQFFQQGAVPGGLLHTDQKLSSRTFHRIREQFDEHHRGVGAAHKVAVLEQGLQYTQAGLSHKDMEFLNLRKYSRETIMQIFGMKSTIISVSENGNNANLADAQRKEWWQTTNLPIIHLIEQSLNRIFLKDPKGVQLVFDISNVEALHENYAARVETGERLFKMGFTAQEVNERLNLGFDKRPWREKWYIPTNMAPVNDDGTAYIQNPTGAGAPGQMTPNNTPAPQEAPAAPGEGAPKPPKKPKKPKKDFEEDGQAEVWQEVGKTLSAHFAATETAFEKKLTRLFFEMRKEALGKVESAPEGIASFTFPEAQKNIKKYTKELYLEILREGYATLDYSKGYKEQNPEIIDFLARKEVALVAIVDTVHKQIVIQANHWTAAHESKEQLIERVKEVFRHADKRAKIIAQTEVWSTVNFSRHLAIKEIAPYKRWVSVMDATTRASHAEMHGQVAGSGDLWTLSNGTTLRFPADLRGNAKDVIGCRCFEIPVHNID